MENVYHSNKNVLLDTKRKNVAKKHICMQNKLHAKQYSLFPARLPPSSPLPMPTTLPLLSPSPSLLSAILVAITITPFVAVTVAYLPPLLPLLNIHISKLDTYLYPSRQPHLPGYYYLLYSIPVLIAITLVKSIPP